MPKKKRERHQATGAPEWMTIYGDMVTLLLAFFVLLYSFSVLDVQKFQQIMSSIQISFLGEQGIMELSPDPSSGEMIELTVDHNFQDVLVTYQEVKEQLRQEGLEGMIKTRIEERGVVLEIQDQILFDSGRAEIRQEAQVLLQKVARIIAEMPNQIIVEGHTDNVPINTAQFPSNWELSVTRAVRVVRFFSEEQKLPARRFIASGYGEYQPLATNLTVAGRAQNRRVNIIISDLNLLDGEATQNEQ
ncbi:MAG: OmpA family protein [Dethiobacter sp.]|jgi:chemotaxis protein MotB|nr:OmpA family protein [Dethiobacter sp.]MBS3902185.1 OmpA family protein [Dethiobacter sp.]MBS3988743.1 OmpA family protein [Dethiobacter sp.]